MTRHPDSARLDWIIIQLLYGGPEYLYRVLGKRTGISRADIDEAMKPQPTTPFARNLATE